MRGGNHDLRSGDLRHADDLHAVGWTSESAAGASAWLDKRFQTEPQAIPIARHGDGVDRRGHSLLPRRDVSSHSRIQAVAGDDPFPIAQLEELLHRFAV